MVIGMGGRLLVASALAFSVGALTGCGNVADSGEEGSRSSSVSVSTPASGPSELPVPLPTMPPEMANNDAVGAEAAARYFVELVNFSYANRETVRMEELSDDSCIFCNEVMAEIQRMRGEEVQRHGGALDVLRVHSSAYVPSSGAHIVTLEVEEHASRFVDLHGTVRGEKGMQQHLIDFVVVGRDGNWVLLASGNSE